MQPGLIFGIVASGLGALIAVTGCRHAELPRRGRERLAQKSV